MNITPILKPCPFCAAPAQLKYGGEGADRRYGCCCTGSQLCPAIGGFLAHRTAESAITAWNSRAARERK